MSLSIRILKELKEKDCLNFTFFNTHNDMLDSIRFDQKTCSYKVYNREKDCCVSDNNAEKYLNENIDMCVEDGHFLFRVDGREISSMIMHYFEIKYEVIFVSTAFISGAGKYRCTQIKIDEVKEIVSKALRITSAVWHDGKASIMSRDLHQDITANRIRFKQDIGDKVIYIAMKDENPECLMSADTIDEVGYNYYLLERLL